jgi:hypothetical protein
MVDFGALRSRTAQLAPWAALVIALALAIWNVVSMGAKFAGQREPFDELQQVVVPFRDSVTLSSKVAVLQTEDEFYWFAAIRYGLAPTTVFRIRLSDACMKTGWRPECVGDATHLVITNFRPDIAASLGARLGFRPLTGTTGAQLLVRESP